MIECDIPVRHTSHWLWFYPVGQEAPEATLCNGGPEMPALWEGDQA